MAYLGGYPSAKFAFPRSYFYQIVSSDQPNDYATLVGSTLTVVYNSVSGYRAVYDLLPEIIPWNSNRYTLDYAVQSAHWFGTWADAPHEHDWTCNFQVDDVTGIMSLVVANAYVYGFRRWFPVEQQPSNYWTPPPLM